MKRNLTRMLLVAAMAGLPFLSVSPFNWTPVGDSVDANGFARTGGLYVFGDYVAVDGGPGFNQNFSSTGVDNTLNIYGTLYTAGDAVTQVPGAIPCSLKINGNVILDATAEDMIINIQEDTIIEPFFDSPSPGDEAGCSQIYFNTPFGRTIDINVNNNLEFRGKTTANDYRDLLITFRGRGAVRFNMADGTSVWFNGQVDTDNGLTLDPETGLFVFDAISANAGGTKVFVLMDQTQSDIANNCHKVAFCRQSLGVDNERVMIGVGANSVITYLSDNPTGLVSDDFPAEEGGWGRICFDPSNIGSGRMVLFIRGAYDVDNNEFIGGAGEEGIRNPDFMKIINKYPFNDGAVIIAGHFVSSFDPEVISGCNLGTEGQSFEPGFDFSVPAGIRAMMCVCDDKFYNNGPLPYEASIDNRRGLLVVNDVQNHGKLASDTYWDLYTSSAAGFIGVDFAYSNPLNALRNVRKGFVVGVNGHIKIYHNVFLDHVTGSTNQIDPLAEFDFEDASILKKRNPAAVIIDNIDPALFIFGNPFLLDNEGQPAPSLFEAANPFTQAIPQHAKIDLCGNGAFMTRASANSRFGYLKNFWFSSLDPLKDPTLDFTSVLGLGTGTYDGCKLSPNIDTVQQGEGLHVLDVEGKLEACSSANNAVIDKNTLAPRQYATVVDNSGIMTMPTVLIDHTGREVVPDGFGGYILIDRPLLADGSVYTRYNSPTMFFNDHFCAYDVIMYHSDATKNVDGCPNSSEPAITGGERLYFSREFWGDTEANRTASPDRYRFPELQFFNGELQLHESLNASGVRFVYKDIPGVNDTTGDSTSKIRFFDHGDPLDTALLGHGRIFMLGSCFNQMADMNYPDGLAKDGSQNYVTNSAFLNVFKHNLPLVGVEDPLNDSSQVTLSLMIGDEFHPGIPSDQFNTQRALHLIMLGQPDECKTPGAVVNARIGWTTLQGDSSPFPSSYPYPGNSVFPGESLIGDPDQLFSNDAFLTPPARISIDAPCVGFGSFDKRGNSIPVPLATENDSGAIYVDHGGELIVTRPEGDHYTSIPNQAVFSTLVGLRLANDYDEPGINRVRQMSGKVILPFDQVDFEQNMGVQVYNITTEMFAERRAETDGVRINLTTKDETEKVKGEEEVIIGWFNRQLQDVNFFDPVKTAPISQFKKWNMRATESIQFPVEDPTDLLFFGGQDTITQLKIYGATKADPLHLGIAGDGGESPFVACVREIVSGKTTRDNPKDRFISEGDNGVLFLELGGRVGLGNREWNCHSKDAWNKLGKDHVTIVPLGGSGVVELNSDIIITDKLALIAGESFGSESEDRLTFISETPHEIRLPKGQELDLTNFGQGDNRQLIQFAGKVRFVVEEGAIIRFPNNPNAGLALYFNDESELIFEGQVEPSVFIPNRDAEEADCFTTKIMGQGSIFTNKNAIVRCNKAARVAVVTDEWSPETDITISMRRASRFEIGNENLSGGAFYIGNYSDRGENESINFQLLIDGPSAQFHIDREGFFGLGACVINKHDNPNGGALVALNPVLGADGVATLGAGGLPVFNPDIDPTSGVWMVKPAFNVNNVIITVQEGVFDHSNIADGSESNASLMAIGQANNFTWQVNGDQFAEVLGGGNIMRVPELLPIGADSFFVNIWNYAGELTTGESYNILASAPLLRDRNDVEFGVPNIIAAFGDGGTAFAGLPDGLFEFLGFDAFETQPAPKVVIGATPDSISMAYTIDGPSTVYPTAGQEEIVRLENPAFTGPDINLAIGTGAGNASSPDSGIGAGTPHNIVGIRHR